jgi:hypothetical protein
VLHIENLAGNVFTTTFSAAGTPKPLAVEAASATIATRIDGINYYNIENLSLTLGSGDDVFNVQGTTATTSLDLGAGDDALRVVRRQRRPRRPGGLPPGHPNYINGALTSIRARARTGCSSAARRARWTTATSSSLTASDRAGRPGRPPDRHHQPDRRRQ